MSLLLGAEQLHLQYPNRVVLDSVTLGIFEGDRIGIVGRNGDGKSSLIRLLFGELEPYSGRVTPRNGVRMGLLSQSDSLDENASVRYEIVGDAPEHEWASDAKIRDVINGLLSDISFERSIGALSGGQRRRVALAKLLVGDWDVIGLDEPTNHLDIEGIHWLARHIKGRWSAGQGAFIVITHDRWFLDEVCTSTWEVHDGIVEPFEGGYAAYVLQRVERDRIAAATEQKRQNLARKELAWLRRGAPARTSKPRFRIEAANALIADVPEVRNPLELKRLATARLGKDVIDLIDVSVRYGENTVFSDVTWRIAPGERTGILGANGAGKSTLLSLIAGTLEASEGRVKRGKTVQVAVLDQQFRELEDIANDRVRDVLARTKTTFTIDGKDFTPAKLLERLGFAKDHLSTRVGDLSGGQRRRLQLLLVLLSEPNVLILDEPTNDVDTDMLTALEDMLDSWPGTLIVVSHDRYLLERVSDQQYAVIGGTLRHLPGGVEEYLDLRAKEERERAAEASGSAGADGASGSNDGLSGAQLRAAQKEASALERRIEKLRGQIAKIHAELAEHDPADFEGLTALGQKASEREDEIAECEERWFDILEQVEGA
ncbi:ABC-F family ATP-binding cassette domain-containing protein [Dermabacter sp. p3-SID358]|uniref:ABC-F family ATP-binding cassette domain-containing protein n=1 Tax=Dermabacter sp. p3-SID358 TaxID=2916114 RepID=UPI0021A7F2DE|nr:ABC-F family ATP-binding cassette domain-containing protein [Dermabacter sp. p3-SID358]MCT1867526.1 ABC-F family ATP-binding cassette domain-containing protein [Dermabacter sp. p3-SID358]